MKRALCLVVLLSFAVSCRRHLPELQVRVFYSAQNPATEKLRRAEREFSFTDPRLNGGEPFLVIGSVSNDPTAAIANRGRSAKTDLFLLKSAAEVPDIPELRKSMGDSFTVCGQAVAYIPDWVNEERREGAAAFLRYLSSHCR